MIHLFLQCSKDPLQTVLSPSVGYPYKHIAYGIHLLSTTIAFASTHCDKVLHSSVTDCCDSQVILGSWLSGKSLDEREDYLGGGFWRSRDM